MILECGNFRKGLETLPQVDQNLVSNCSEAIRAQKLQVIVTEGLSVLVLFNCWLYYILHFLPRDCSYFLSLQFAQHEFNIRNKCVEETQIHLSNDEQSTRANGKRKYLMNLSKFCYKITTFKEKCDFRK